MLLPLLRLHEMVYRDTNGRMGRQMPGMPPQFLSRITGERTIRQRGNTTTYAKSGDSYRAVASCGGNEKHPGRHHTLRNRMECEIYIGSRVFIVSARRIGADALWRGDGKSSTAITRTGRRLSSNGFRAWVRGLCRGRCRIGRYRRRAARL
ncbi:nitroreductase/quinone reductase family protein [Mycobacterium asiaticum]|uniref:nitroreductase/quinone reductase family protein n=1 Tax=Mycobacterium asiaticum TaxID=1790 RepID=UPI0009C153FF